MKPSGEIRSIANSLQQDTTHRAVWAGGKLCIVAIEVEAMEKVLDRLHTEIHDSQPTYLHPSLQPTLTDTTRWLKMIKEVTDEAVGDAIVGVD